MLWPAACMVVVHSACKHALHDLRLVCNSMLNRHNSLRPPLPAGALYNSLFTFPEEFKHMLKERASGMVRPAGVR